ncbi:DUF4376 domain-containing protein [Pseudomonas sp. UMAB-08]|uniref:DUF4376 domain-containing protein n=1 Tax=Pseudomonas sp. UMAB-08 TaxID=1365375 RepID=UPI00214A9D8D|nr:DUF4376 domain-containing protein [Pseudomonas sp. UMAB-08]
MILYQWDEQGFFVGSVEVEDTAPMPERSTPTTPMVMTGTQVAQWQGVWVKLAARPVTPDPQPMPDPVPDLPILIADRRYTAETSGTTVEGMPIDTSRDSQSMLTGAALAASLDPGYSVQWKTTAGFVTLTSSQILGVASAVRAHVQACFNREAALLAAVADGSITAVMVEEGWPSRLYDTTAKSDVLSGGAK